MVPSALTQINLKALLALWERSQARPGETKLYESNADDSYARALLQGALEETDDEIHAARDDTSARVASPIYMIVFMTDYQRHRQSKPPQVPRELVTNLPIPSTQSPTLMKAARLLCSSFADAVNTDGPRKCYSTAARVDSDRVSVVVTISSP